MHMLGDPRTMQENPVYDDVVDDVKAFLAERIEFAVAEGIEEERIWVDPGIGFGKTVEHNLELHRRLGELAELGRPIAFGSSRKSFIGKLTGAEVDDRLGGTIASNVIAYANGAACSGSTTSGRCARRSRSPRRSCPTAVTTQLPISGAADRSAKAPARGAGPSR